MFNESDKKFPFLLIAIIAVIIGIAFFLLWKYQIPPVYNLLNGTFTSLSNVGTTISNSIPMNNLINQAVTGIQENPLAFGVTAVSGVGAVWGIVSKIRADHLRQQTEAAAQQRINDLDNYYKTELTRADEQISGIVGLQKKITTLEEELNNTEGLKSTIQRLEKSNSSKDETIRSLEDMLKTLKLEERVIVK